MQTNFGGSTMRFNNAEAWAAPTATPPAAAVLGDQALHDLTTNDVFWDKIAEITSIGERDRYRVSVAATHNVVAQGVSVRASLEQSPRS
jgi:hypothetical protein